MHMRLCLASCALALLTASARAQLPRDSWVVAAFTQTTSPGGLWVVAPGQTAVTQPQPQTPAMAGANAVACDSGGMIWYATIALVGTTSANEIFWVITTPTNVTLETRLTNGPVGPLGGTSGIAGLTRLGSQIWYCTLEGAVGWVNAFQPAQAPNVVMTVPLTSGNYLNGIATDGREIYLARYGGSAGPNILAFDPSAAAPVLRSVATVPTTTPSAMSLGPGGSILVAHFSSTVVAVNSVTGTVTNASNTTLYPLNGLGCNPWLRLCAVVPGGGATPRPVDFLDLTTGLWLPNTLTIGPGCAPAGVTAVCEDPCLLYGSGCPGSGGVESRLRWSGLPVPGGTMAITVQPATANTLALFLLGLSRTTSPLGNLPLDGTPFGAPGCRLLVSPDVVLPQLTTAGVHSQPLALPNSAGLSGLVAFSQWGVLAPVNPLGFVTSEAVEIRVR